jgi:hypothetical protein
MTTERTMTVRLTRAEVDALNWALEIVNDVLNITNLGVPEVDRKSRFPQKVLALSNRFCDLATEMEDAWGPEPESEPETDLATHLFNTKL